MTRRPAIGIIVPLSARGEAGSRIRWDHASLQAIEAAGGQVQLLPILLTEGSKQEALFPLTGVLEGIDGLLLVDQTADLERGSLEERRISGLLERAASLAGHLQVPVLGIGDGSEQIVTGNGGSLHAQRRRREQAAHEALPASRGLVMLDRSCFSRCLPQRYAERVQAEEDVLAVECLPQGRVLTLASPFFAWAWSCSDASIVAFGTPLEIGSYAVGTHLPIQSEELRSTRFSRLLFGSFVEAARERGTRSQQIDEEMAERTLGAVPGSLQPGSFESLIHRCGDGLARQMCARMEDLSMKQGLVQARGARAPPARPSLILRQPLCLPFEMENRVWHRKAGAGQEEDF